MKNILNYYYQMIISEDKINNGYFSYNNHLFYIGIYNRNLNEIKELYELNQYMIQNSIQINVFILNINGEPITFYDGKYYYVLLIKYNKSYFYEYVPRIVYHNYNLLNRNNWGFLWSHKIDYIEYQLMHLGNKYPIIQNSIHYYIGMSENAISYFNMLKKDNISLYISHRRINNNDLYNPCDLIIDYKVRDLSEYIKFIFFNNKKSILDIINYLNCVDLENMDYYLLYVRMLYPSFYFDKYDEIVNNNEKESIINDIIELVDDYERLLYDIYKFISQRVNIIGIDWINKKFR